MDSSSITWDGRDVSVSRAVTAPNETSGRWVGGWGGGGGAVSASSALG